MAALEALQATPSNPSLRSSTNVASLHRIAPVQRYCSGTSGNQPGLATFRRSALTDPRALHGKKGSRTPSPPSTPNPPQPRPPPSPPSHRFSPPPRRPSQTPPPPPNPLSLHRPRGDPPLPPNSYPAASKPPQPLPPPPPRHHHPLLAPPKRGFNVRRDDSTTSEHPPHTSSNHPPPPWSPSPPPPFSRLLQISRSSVAVHSAHLPPTSLTTRTRQSQYRLLRDIFNEGVDLPTLDTVYLRPHRNPLLHNSVAASRPLERTPPYHTSATILSSKPRPLGLPPGDLVQSSRAERHSGTAAWLRSDVRARSHRHPQVAAASKRHQDEALQRYYEDFRAVHGVRPRRSRPIRTATTRGPFESAQARGRSSSRRWEI